MRLIDQLYSPESKVIDMLYQQVTAHLIPSLRWNKDNRIRLRTKTKTSWGTNTEVWYKYKKDMRTSYNVRQLHLGTACKVTVNRFVYNHLPEKYKELHKKSGVGTKINNYFESKKNAKERAKERSKIRTVEVRKKTSLEFGQFAQRDIAKSILFHFINEKMDILKLDLEASSKGVLNLFSESSWDEFPYLFKALDSSLVDLDITGKVLFREMRKLTAGNEQEFIKKHLLMSEDNNVRRFAVAFVDMDSIAIGLLDSTDKVRYAAERLLQV